MMVDEYTKDMEYFAKIKAKCTQKSLTITDFSQFMEFNCVQKSREIVGDFHMTLTFVITRHPSHLKSVLLKIFRDFSLAREPPEENSISLFSRLIVIFQPGIESLIAIVVKESLPFFKKPKSTVSSFVKNVLHVIPLLTITSRREIMTILISFSLEIDSHIGSEWPRVADGEDELLYDKLASLMDHLVDFAGKDALSLKDWLFVFERTLLVVSNTRQLQLVYLYVVRGRRKGFGAFVLYLWRRVIDGHRSDCIRLNALSYLRSLLLHAQGLQRSVVRFALGLITQWIGLFAHYQTSPTTPDLNVFYHLFEMLAQVVVTWEVEFDNIDHVLSSRWNPIGFLREDLAELFVLVVWRLGLSGNAFTVLRRNRRLGVESSVEGMWDPFGEVVYGDGSLVRGDVEFGAVRRKMECGGSAVHDEDEDILWDCIYQELAEGCV